MRFKSVLALLLFVGAPLAAADKHFRILQINDVYKIEGLENGAIGGLARVRTLRKQLEADGTPVLLLHAGDALFPSVMSKYLAAQPMIRVLNLLDGDAAAFDAHMAAAIGNHELENPDPLYALGRLTQSDFTWLTCNVWYCAGGKCKEPFSKRVHNVADTITFDVGGIDVAVIGLTTDSGTSDYFKVDFKDRQQRTNDVRDSTSRSRRIPSSTPRCRSGCRRSRRSWGRTTPSAPRSTSSKASSRPCAATRPRSATSSPTSPAPGCTPTSA